MDMFARLSLMLFVRLVARVERANVRVTRDTRSGQVFLHRPGTNGRY
ncbi:hypothetical protein [Alcanivorax hongdengensis]|nr:hypothetical protein [Alcanivorax hongdengensis]